MLKVLNGPTIQAGESLSDAVDCSGGELVRITMPPDWDTASITFQFSTDGVFFNEMYEIDSFATIIKTVVPGAGVIIPAYIGRAIAFLKIRSGVEDNPVEQSADRNFAVTIFVAGEAEDLPPPIAKRKARQMKPVKKPKRK